MRLITALSVSVAALVSASSVYAADIVAPAPAIAPLKVQPSQVIEAPAFSWEGFYLGVQGGMKFSDESGVKTDAKKDEGNKGNNNNNLQADKDKTNDDKSASSNIFGGAFAGYNVDLGSGLIFGVETDLTIGQAGKNSVAFAPKDVTDNYKFKDKEAKAVVDKFVLPEADKTSLENYLNGKDKKAKDSAEADVSRVLKATKKGGADFTQQWAGATRVRLGFAVDRIMPYIAGGIAYTSVTADAKAHDEAVAGPGAGADPKSAADARKDAGLQDKYVTADATDSGVSNTLVGFSIGGGVDFAVADNVLLRAEYRYTDFGDKEFNFTKADTKVKYGSQNQDVRVGVAFKF
ncbi:outer membrane protein [Bartonella sp. DGB2]|uniref:outer membrane protein n=1 Tax=Bartonella sp. DGB2 TaxID=3388426 RepID=UPI00398FD3BC